MSHRACLACLVMLCSVGCTTMRQVASSPDVAGQRLHHGDHLTAYERSGRIVEMTFEQLDGNTLVGTLTSDGCSAVKIDLHDVERLEREEIDGVKTTFAAVGVTAVLVPVLLVTLLVVSADAFSD